MIVNGRGASWNPQNRFERLEYVVDEDAHIEENPDAPRTLYLRDPTRTIIATNDSPDIGFDASINPYRGCEHGCIYCYARPSHEYLGFSAGLDFETKILVKEDAPALLREELNAKKWEPKVIVISGVTDPYQPIERRLGITRGCLEVLADFRNPVGLITKNLRRTDSGALRRKLPATRPQRRGSRPLDERVSEENGAGVAVLRNAG